MRGKKLLIFILIFLLLFSIPGFTLDFLYPAKVERVMDGDTIVVSLTLGLDVVLEHQRIGFYDIDAESSKENKQRRGWKQRNILRRD